MEKIKGILLPALLVLLIFTRFFNLAWGLPFPFHPDERNLADALQQLQCNDISTCLHPHFFAYGQLPLYIGYIILGIYDIFKLTPGDRTFIESVMALRLISAVASIATSVFLYKILELLTWQKGKDKVPFYIVPLVSFLFIFSPVLIQFAHFGTTESLLMFFFVGNLYLGIRLVKNTIPLVRFILLAGIVSGLAIGTKITAAPYVLLPLVALLMSLRTLSWNVLRMGGLLGVVTAVFALISSPYNLLSFTEFMGSMRYESAVATGAIEVFYTRQFFETIPLVFHALHIFPYTLGLGVFIFSLVAFIRLPWTKEYNFIRFALILGLVPSIFFFAKWSRFIAPAYPVFILLLAVFIAQHKKMISRYAKLLMVFIVLLIIPGIAYLSVYAHQDIRIIASRWMYENLPKNTQILSESANVVDIPIPQPSYPAFSVLAYSFNFYDVDVNPSLQKELGVVKELRDYVLVPSRRVYANHTCESVNGIDLAMKERCEALKQKYPVLNAYYRELFDESKYKKVREFTSYPKISILGRTIVEFPDQFAEETWSVFDHPVIQLYKKVN